MKRSLLKLRLFCAAVMLLTALSFVCLPNGMGPAAAQAETPANAATEDTARMSGNYSTPAHSGVAPAGETNERDGSKIESVHIEWVTPDTTDDGWERWLYLSTSSDSELRMQYQLDVSFSGQHDYEPGDIQITIPRQIWHRRDESVTDPDSRVELSAGYGTMTFSVPNVSERSDSEYYYEIDDENGVYVIKNRKTIGATSKVMLQFTYTGLTPHEIVDMAVSDAFHALVDVRTNQDNTISMQSDDLIAQIDTQEHITGTVKGGELYEDASQVPESLLANLPAGANPEDYVFVKWYTYPSYTGNQPFTLNLSDTVDWAYDGDPKDEESNKLVRGVMLGSEKTGAVTDGETMTAEAVTRRYVSPQMNGSFNYYLWTAYDVSSFEDDHTYYFPNTVEWTLTERDGTIGQTWRGTDDKEVTKAVASDVVMYTKASWDYPPGVFMVFKYADDDTTHTHPTRSSDQPSPRNYTHVKNETAQMALSALRRGNEVDLTYETLTVGYGYIFTAGPLANAVQWEDINGNIHQETISEDYDDAWNSEIFANDPDHYLNWSYTMDTTDRWEYFNNVDASDPTAQLKVSASDDYYFKGITIAAPEMFKFGRTSSPRFRQDAANVFGFEPDEGLEKPAVEVYIELNNGASEDPVGGWQYVGTFDVSSETKYIDFSQYNKAGQTVTGYRTRITTNQAAVKLAVYPTITLKPSERISEIVEALYGLTDTPTTTTRNDDMMYVELFVEAADKSVYDEQTNPKGMVHPNQKMFEDNGKDSDSANDEDFRMYIWQDDARHTLTSAGYGAWLDKTQTYTNNPANKRVDLHYTAKVTEASNLSDRALYDLAIELGAIDEEKSGVWYDLLPLGVVPDLDSVRVREGDVIKHKYIETDTATGRLLLVVEVDLQPVVSMDPYTQVWRDVITLDFDAYYDWKEIDVNGNNLVNYAAFESGNEEQLGNLKNRIGEEDKPVRKNNMYTPGRIPEDVMQDLTDLDPNTDGPLFVYGRTDLNLNIDRSATTDYSKAVSSDLEGIWTQGLNNQVQVNVYEGQNYTYRLRVASSEGTQTTNMVLYDSIENYDLPHDGTYHQDLTKVEDYADIEKKHVWYGTWQGDLNEARPTGQWRGTLTSVDVKEFIDKGCAPVIYYSTETWLQFGDTIDSSKPVDETIFFDTTGRYNLTDAATWKKVDTSALAEGVWTVPEGTAVTAIAIDARKKTDGSDFILGSLEEVQAYLHMKAPDDQEDATTWGPAKSAYARFEGMEESSDLSAIDWESARNPENNMHAFNNTRLICMQVAEGSQETSKTTMIRNDYTRVGIMPRIMRVTKEWEDQNNHDGIRPEEVEVSLYRKTRTDADYTDTGVRVTLNEANNWTEIIKQMDVVDENGKPYIYEFRDDVTGYTFINREDGDGVYTLINRHENEKTERTVGKKWVTPDGGELPEEAESLIPASVTVHLLRDGEECQNATVKPDAQGNWSYNFKNLERYRDHGAEDFDPANGEEHVYTIVEDPVEFFISSTSDYAAIPANLLADFGLTEEDFSNEPGELKNYYVPYGNLSVEKHLVDATEVSNKNAFTFTLVLTDKNEIPLDGLFAYEIVDAGTGEAVAAADLPEGQAATGRLGNGDSFRLKDGQKLVLQSVPAGTLYRVEEDVMPGFMQAPKNNTGEVHAGQTTEAQFENTYRASALIQLPAVKSLDGHKMTRNQFRFELVDETEGSDTYGEVLLLNVGNNASQDTAQASLPGPITNTAVISFPAISYTQADHGKTFTYRAREVDRERPGYTYDSVTYTYDVYVEDNGDGTMTATVVSAAKVDAAGTETPVDVTNLAESVRFENKYTAEGEYPLKLWKVLDGREIKEGEFTFELYRSNADGAALELIDTKTNTANGMVYFDPIHFTQDDVSLDLDNPAKYYFLAKEVRGEDETVEYTEDAYLYTVRVYDNNDGTLSFAQDGQSVTYEHVPCQECEGTGKRKDYLLRIIGHKYRMIPNGLMIPGKWIFTTDLRMDENNAFILCPECNGTGTEPNTDSECTRCNGFGMIYKEFNASHYSDAIDAPGNITSSQYLRDAIIIHLNGEDQLLQGEFTFYRYDWDKDYTNLHPEYARFGGYIDVTSLLDHHTSEKFCYYLLSSSGSFSESPENRDYVSAVYIGLVYDDTSCPDCRGTGLVLGPAHVDGQYSDPRLINKLKPGDLVLRKEIQNGNPDQEFKFRIMFTGEQVDYAISYHLPDDVEEKEDTLPPQPAPVEPVVNSKNWYHAANDGWTEEMLEKTTAYALYSSRDGSLTFFRSERDYQEGPFYGSATFYGMYGRRYQATSGGYLFADVEKEVTPPSEIAGKWSRFYVDGYYTSSALYGLPTYIKSIVIKDDPIRPLSMHKYFAHMDSVVSIDIRKLDTSKARDFSYAFDDIGADSVGYHGGSSYTIYHEAPTINVSTMDTSNATDMNNMFAFCKFSNSVLDLSSFDTSKVKNMNRMLYSTWVGRVTKPVADRHWAGNIVLSSFDTSNVEDMGYMFSGLAVKELDISTFDTSKVKNMERMLAGVRNNIDIRHLITSNVTNMEGMFSGAGMTELDLSYFDTSKVTDMSYMFSGMNKLKELKGIEGFDTALVSNMGYMFNNDSQLTSLDLSGFDISNVTSLWSMFSGDYNLRSLNLENFKPSADISSLFSGDRNVKILDLRGFSNLGNNYTWQNTGALVALRLPENVKMTTSPSSDYGYPGGSADAVWTNTDTGESMTARDLFCDPDKPYSAGLWMREGATAVVFDPGEEALGSIGALAWMQTTEGNTFTLTNKYTRPGYRVIAFTDGNGHTYSVDLDTDEFTVSAGDFSDQTKVTLTAVWAATDHTIPVNETQEVILKAGEEATFTNIPAGLQYTVEELTPAGWVLVSKTNDEGVIPPADTVKSIFTNDYRPNEAWAYLKAEKHLDGKLAKEADLFTFELYEADADGKPTGDAIDTKTVPASGIANFEPIVYAGETTLGEHRYVIVEVPGEDPEYEYDSHTEPVTVTVTDDGVGNYSAEIVYKNQNGAVFENTTKPGSLKITKVLENATAKAAEETFTVTVTFPNGLTETLQTTDTDADGAATVSRVTPENNAVVLTIMGGHTVTLSDIPAGTAYYVKEAALDSWTLTGAKRNETEDVLDWMNEEFQYITPDVLYTITPAVTDSFTITNTYDTQGSVNLKAEKQLEGEIPEGYAYTFCLYEADENGEPTGEALQTKTNNPLDKVEEITKDVANPDYNKSMVLFDQIKYTEEGTYRYVIVEDTEVNDETIIPDTRRILATVNVTDEDGKGELTAEVTYTGGENNSNIFLNKRRNGSLEISKTVLGATPAAEGQTFTVSLDITDRDGKALTGTYPILRNGEEGGNLSVAEGHTTFTITGGETVKITELPHGAAYTLSEAEADMPAGFTMTASEGTTGTITGNVTNSASFENTYKAQGETILEAEKRLTQGMTMTAGEFGFYLKDDQNKILQYVTNDLNGHVAFEPIAYTTADLDENGEATFTYTVTENQGAASSAPKYNYSFDDSEWTVVVSVKDENGNGTLTVKQEIRKDGEAQSGISFLNSESTMLRVIKKWAGVTEHTELPTSINLTILADGREQQRTFMSQRVNGQEDGTWVLSVNGLPKYNEDGSLIKYTVKEDPVSGFYTQYDSPIMHAEENYTEAAIINTWAETTITLGGVKTVEGMELREGDFSFTLTSELGGVPMPEETLTDVDAEGNFSFDEILYTLGDLDTDENGNPVETRFVYYIEENLPEDADYHGVSDGIRYDTEKKKVVVTLTPDAAANTLTAEKDPADDTEIEFVNRNVEGRISLRAEKTLKGRTLQAGAFSFTLTAVDRNGNALTGEDAYSETVKNDTDGLALFSEMTYDFADIDQADGQSVETKKYYTIKENIPDPKESGITYDKTVHMVTVTLKDSGDGAIVTTAEGAEAIEGEDGSIVYEVGFVNTYEKPDSHGYDYRFSFTKKWTGPHGDSIDWTLYDSKGNVVHKKFNKKIISEDEWYYEAWFPNEAEYYIIETVPDGFKARYENTGAHAGETDRCYNGGTIINHKVPKTGDPAKLSLWTLCILLGLAAVSTVIYTSRRRK